MGSDSTATRVDTDNLKPETSGNSFFPSKRKRAKIPKRIHKSEREKLKRENLNDLFFNLASALESRQQNIGKASILTEATRLLKDMLGQVASLKRDNEALLLESQYVAGETNELREETSSLGVEIKELQNKIEASAAQSKPDLNMAPPEVRDPKLAAHLVHDCPGMGPVYVLPLGSCYGGPDPDPAINPASNVSKPHARYPTSDSWPSQLLGLGGQPEASL